MIKGYMNLMESFGADKAFNGHTKDTINTHLVLLKSWSDEDFSGVSADSLVSRLADAESHRNEWKSDMPHDTLASEEIYWLGNAAWLEVLRAISEELANRVVNTSPVDDPCMDYYPDSE